MPSRVTNHRDLMQRHVEALFSHDASGDLVRVNEPDGGRAPRFFIGTTVHGSVLRFRDDVAPDLRRKLEAVVIQQHSVDSPRSPSPYADILAGVAPILKTWTGPAFCFPSDLPTGIGTVRITEADAELLSPFFQRWIPDVRLCQPMIAMTIDSHAVAMCCSVRATSVAHEAGVETAALYRGRGYAGHVATAWARAVRSTDRIPLYSTSWENTASRTVADKLRLTLFGNDVHVT